MQSERASELAFHMLFYKSLLSEFALLVFSFYLCYLANFCYWILITVNTSLYPVIAKRIQVYFVIINFISRGDLDTRKSLIHYYLSLGIFSSLSGLTVILYTLYYQSTCTCKTTGNFCLQAEPKGVFFPFFSSLFSQVNWMLPQLQCLVYSKIRSIL